jgi:hypothetical protein
MKNISTRMLALTMMSAILPGMLLAGPMFPAPKSIYGIDNRQDYFEAFPAMRQLSDSVASFWKGWSVEPAGGNYNLYTENFGEQMNLCPGEKFREQPTGAFCSGSLVGDDLVMTAGHCIKDEAGCADAKIVFGFAVTTYGGKAPTTIPQKDVYSCKQIITRLQESAGADYALIRLDRKVEGRRPLVVSRGGQIKTGDKVFVIGYPVGIPLKVSGDATVRDASKPGYFVTNLDTFGGNSGSPVFNASNNLIEGILVRGAEDFKDIAAEFAQMNVPGQNGTAEPPAQCTTMAMYPQDGGRGEDVTKVSALGSFIPGKAASVEEGKAKEKPVFKSIDANTINIDNAGARQDLNVNFQ